MGVGKDPKEHSEVSVGPLLHFRWTSSLLGRMVLSSVGHLPSLAPQDPSGEHLLRLPPTAFLTLLLQRAPWPLSEERATRGLRPRAVKPEFTEDLLNKDLCLHLPVPFRTTGNNSVLLCGRRFKHSGREDGKGLAGGERGSPFPSGDCLGRPERSHCRVPLCSLSQ